MGTDERTEPNKNKMGMQAQQISLLVPYFQRTYQLVLTQESEKAPGKLKVTLKKMSAKKMRAQWARLQSCKKNKTRIKKIDSYHLFKTRFS